MPFDGSGNYNRNFPPGGWQGDAAANIKIKADRHDQHDGDLATALSNVICKDGQSSPSADIGFNSKKIINLAPGVNPTDAVNLNQLQAYNTTAGANPSGIIVSGSNPNSMVKFTGSTGPWGDSYVTADLFFGTQGATPAAASWIWNDKADATGNNTLHLTPDNAGVNRSTLILKSLDDTASSGPWFYLQRESPSPLAGDILGAIGWNARTSTGLTKEYAAIYTEMSDPTNGSEDGNLHFRAMTAGTNAVFMSITDKVVFPQGRIGIPTGTLIFDGTLNSELFLNKSASGGYSYLMGQTAGKHRWLVAVGDSVAETGANAGSNFGIIRYNDDGTGGSSVMSISRAGLTTTFPYAVEISNFSNTGATNGHNLSGVNITTSRNVSGAAAHLTFYNPAGAGVYSGQITTTNATTQYTTTSDGDLKNLNGGYDPLEAIAVIRADPVQTFAFKSVPDVQEIGWVAQHSYSVKEDLAVPPENLSEGKAFGDEGWAPWGIDYGKRTPYLWAALTWALDKIDALEARLGALEKPA